MEICVKRKKENGMELENVCACVRDAVTLIQTYRSVWKVLLIWLQYGRVQHQGSSVYNNGQS